MKPPSPMRAGRSRGDRSGNDGSNLAPTPGALGERPAGSSQRASREPSSRTSGWDSRNETNDGRSPKPRSPSRRDPAVSARTAPCAG